MSPKLPISGVIITLNAAHQLEECLQSLALCAEIVVVDSGSSDGTQALAARYGARIIEQPWLGFGPQKQFATQQASYPWVLCLDADERLSAPLQQSIVELFSTQPPAQHAYQMPRCNRFMGRWLRHGEGYPDPNLRLFHRDYAHWSQDPVHEHVVALGAVGNLAGDILHHSEEGLECYLNKQNRYTSLQAEKLAQGKAISPHKIYLSPLFRFIKFYLLRRGFLDGLPGLLHILIGCFNSMIKYAKAYHHQQNPTH
ncbi:glycosyl transferase, family 2 [Magnetococcus marinus MC-1]|uniref:Glycosyl transferase, family 2 n=1 Tax=Magnetococcus marinus (strain ATCC BAA-1437 / JCM 17883 / MC-1) TaxID=156889 RepID=A0L7W5_MAGMM|nr:glycosyltransferase family 2 protein [Magnetococcus marinus]ABK44058.1 glycosyl transferase, family 2 [Magnetococcus marinus MC-1]